MRHVVVAVDPGRVYGFAMIEVVDGEIRLLLTRTGKEATMSEVFACLTVAVEHARSNNARAHLVGEKWDAAGMRAAGLGRNTHAGLERAWGVWANMWVDKEMGVGQARNRITRVLPRTWRKLVLGKGGGLDSAGWKLAARAYVKGAFGRDVGPDEAEAACVGLWLAHGLDEHARPVAR